MRNIRLGYTLPAGALKAIKVQSLRVFVMGENLFWTKSSEFLSPDPELVNFGNRTNSSGLPVPTTYTFGFNLNF
jgi:hypothetical protein